MGAAGLHVKVSAPPPFSVVLNPKQITELVIEAVTTGRGFTVTPTVARLVLVQPVSVFVPLTVYTVEAVGVKATPLVAAGVHVKVLAPPPFKVVLPPKHTTELVTDAVTIGSGLTVTAAVARLVLVHPVSVLVPVTE